MDPRPKRGRIFSDMSNMIVSVIKFISPNFPIAVKRQALIPEEIKPQSVEPELPPQVLQPPSEEVRKRSISVLDNLKSDASLAYVDKKKLVF